MLLRGSRVHHVDAFRALVRGQGGAQVRGQRFDVHGSAANGHHPGGHLFSPVLRGDTGNARLGHVGTGLERCLHLLGVDVESAADDQLLEPPGDVQVPRRCVDAPDVTGPEPPARRGTRRQLPPRRRGTRRRRAVRAGGPRPQRPRRAPLPSPSATRSSTPGRGRPTAPGIRAPNTGFDTSSPLSVVPYRSRGVWPSSWRMRAASSAESGAEPEMARRRPASAPAVSRTIAEPLVHGRHREEHGG